MKFFHTVFILVLTITMMPSVPSARTHTPASFPSAARAQGRSRNLLLVTIDTLRADHLGCYDSKHVQTPNIDELAARGVVFNRAFAHTPTTLPSHTNIMLGTTPPYHGVRENSNFVVGDEWLTLAEHLKNNGYATGAFIGGYPLHSRYGLSQGFDTYGCHFDSKPRNRLIQAERPAEEVVQEAIGWLQERKTPWFLWVHCWDPHDPYSPPEPWRTRYAEDLYSGEVAYVDQALGKLFKVLKTRGGWDDTLIIITGDHGESLGEHGERTHGFLAYNTTLRIPLILVFRGAKARRVDDYVDHIDIFPTVCDALKIDKPDELQGISLMPATRNKNLPKRPHYFESLLPYYSRGWAPIHGFIEDGMKFIDSPIPELFDLKSDLNEEKNLAGSTNLAPYRSRMQKLLVEQASSRGSRAGGRYDRESMEKLRSLGYVSFGMNSRARKFGPADDVKTRLPYHNRATEALKTYKDGNVGKAFQILKQVLAEQDDIAIAYYNLAELYNREGRPQDAMQVLKLGAEKIPESYMLFFQLVSSLSDVGLHQKVIEQVTTSDYREMEFDPEIWNILGIAYFRDRQYSKARESYQKALAMGEESVILLTNMGEVLFAESQSSGQVETLASALQCFRQVIRVDPTYARAHLGAGKVLIKASQLEDAIQALEKAYELDSQCDEALYFLGMSHLENHDGTKALEAFLAYKTKFANKLSPQFREQLAELIRRARAEKSP